MASPQIIKCIDGTRVYFHFLFCAEKKNSLASIEKGSNKNKLMQAFQELDEQTPIQTSADCWESPPTHTHTLLTSKTVTDLTMLLTELISRCYEHTCLHPITWTLLPHHLVEIVLLGFLLSSLKVSGWRNQVVWVTRRMSLSPLYSSLTTSS